jgi:hypothetical protein
MPNTSQPLTGIHGTPANSVSGPHVNGHLVSTGQYNFDRIKRLYIHLSNQCTIVHPCQVHEYDAGLQIINDCQGDSADTNIEEHGWFRNVALFQQIVGNHPIPNGQSAEEIFITWRDTLLEFLDTNHGGIGGQWTRVN